MQSAKSLNYYAAFPKPNPQFCQFTTKAYCLSVKKRVHGHMITPAVLEAVGRKITRKLARKSGAWAVKSRGSTPMQAGVFAFKGTPEPFLEVVVQEAAFLPVYCPVCLRHPSCASLACSSQTTAALWPRRWYTPAELSRKSGDVLEISSNAVEIFSFVDDRNGGFGNKSHQIQGSLRRGRIPKWCS